MAQLRGAPEDLKEQDEPTAKSSPSRRTRKGDFSFRTPLPETLSAPHIPEGTVRVSPARSRSPLKTATTVSGTASLDTRPTTPEAHDDNDPFLTKRGPSPPSKHPTPKRQRTLYPVEMATGGQSMADVVEDEHRRMQAATVTVTVGSETPPMSTETIDFAADGFEATPIVESNYDAAETEQFSVLQSRIEEAEVSAEVDDPGTVKALATGLARFQLKSIANLKDSARKPSVSTQDYLNEAMKIMDIIRTARPAPHSELTGLEEEDFIPSDDSQVHSTLAPQQVSRPPSRVGTASVWRTRNDNELDPRVVSRLEKYAENGDDSHMMSSLMKSMRTSHPEKQPAEHDNDIQTVETDLPNIRISGPRASGGGYRVTSSGAHSAGQGHSRPQSLDDSEQSTSKTVTTDTSGRAKSVPTISPGKVSHLISSIEDAAGMRYDRERQAWIKDKAARRRAKSGEPSSSTGTEDPFEQISDLSTHTIDDSRGATSDVTGQDSRTGSANTVQSLSQFPLPGQRGTPQPETQASREPTVEVHPERRRVPPLSNLDVLYEESVLSDDNLHLAEGEENEMDELDYSTQVENLPPTPDRFAKVPDGTIRSKRRDVSVMFSSPPVSRQWDPAAYERASSGTQVDDDEPTETSASTHVRAQQPPSAPSNDLRRQALRNMSTAQANRMMSLAKRDDLREISFVEQRPDGRTLSMTLSVATPRQLQRQAVSAALSAQNKDSSELMQTLSPLSDYTIHRDNTRHLEKRNLVPGTNAMQPVHQKTGAAVVVTKLVEKLTDIEPEEPYWDEMQNLDLSNKSLSDLHMLDHFCPEIERLDVSNNQLQQLGGIPQYVRQLSVRSNSLTNLTTWVQLQHLQYLDISGNGLDSLDGLCDLLHLRELRVDNNKLASLDGVFDLDSLLSLSAKNNKLAMVDFQTADMKRLERLDISGNELVDVRGLESLPALSHLDLSGNILQMFPLPEAQPSSTLKSLILSHNQLETVDLRAIPNLQSVYLDGNKLSHLPTASSRHTITTLSMRDEAPATTFELSSSDLKLFSDLTHLDLSGTPLSAFPIETPFLNLQTLGLALTGLQILPSTFGKMAPNVRHLNLNLNAIKDLRPLRGIAKLNKLYVAGNRLSRLRRTMDVVHLLAAGGNLTIVDLRDNPVSVGIYGSVAPTPTQAAITPASGPHSGFATPLPAESNTPSYLLPSGNAKLDRMYNARLDEDTKLRRRVYELLLATKCTQLELVDGLEWSSGRREEVLRKDGTWMRLREMGVVAEKS
jgi:Leucine-rich repeat (LRR) protein